MPGAGRRGLRSPPSTSASVVAARSPASRQAIDSTVGLAMATPPASIPLHGTKVIISAAKLATSFPESRGFPLESACSTMAVVPRTVDSQCRAFQCAIDVLGRSWNALILNVLQSGPLRFSELAERARGPGDKVLSARLKDLEARGLLVRQVDAGPPVRVAYELTRKGRAFRSLAEAIERWGLELVADDPSRRR